MKWLWIRSWRNRAGSSSPLTFFYIMVKCYQGQEEYKYDRDWRKGVQQRASMPSSHRDLQLKMLQDHLKLTCDSAVLDWRTLEPHLLISHLDFYVTLLQVPSFYGKASVNVHVCQAWVRGGHPVGFCPLWMVVCTERVLRTSQSPPDSTSQAHQPSQGQIPTKSLRPGHGPCTGCHQLSKANTTSSPVWGQGLNRSLCCCGPAATPKGRGSSPGLVPSGCVTSHTVGTCQSRLRLKAHI